MENRICNSKGLFAAILISVLATAIYSCKKDTTRVPGPNNVWMQNMAFNPSSISVPANATVTWTNKDNMGHNVTSDSGWFASGTMDPGGTFTHQFTTKGTYNYRCTIHQGMNGTVVVQ